MKNTPPRKKRSAIENFTSLENEKEIQSSSLLEDVEFLRTEIDTLKRENEIHNHAIRNQADTIECQQRELAILANQINHLLQ